MKIKFNIISIVLLFLAVGCVRNEYSEELAVKEKMVFAAYTEGEDETKTTLDGEVGSSARKVMWDIDDAIGIVAEENSTFEKFINTQADPSAKGLFEGTIRNSENYYAIYPYDETFKKSGSVINFSLPSVQIYKENSFGTDCSPMVAKKSTGEDLKFKNLCGVLVLRMTGDFSVKSITFMAKDESGNYMKVSGGASVDMAYVRTPELVMADDASTSVVLDCGDGVQLSTSESTPFHIVLPVGSYNTFELVITSSDGEILIKEGSKPLAINRSIATKTSDFTPEEVAYVDLSLRGTANCYVVSEKGYYSIDVSVIGNGEAGIIADGGFHTEDPSISPTSVDVLWDDVSGDIHSVTLDKVAKKIRFATNGNEGNALLAVRDANNEILWSWHIWKTDVPVEHKYVNSAGVFYVQDRNLGALRADPGEEDEWHESVGLDFQWGRKDPFTKGVVEDSGPYNIEQYIKYPNVRTNISNGNDKLWLPTQKTIYDPCPSGYRVSSYDIWSHFSELHGDPENGRYFIYDNDGSYAWYPYRGFPSENDIRYWGDNYMISASGVNSGLHFGRYYLGKQRIDGGPLRCMRDDGYIDISVPTVIINKIDNIQTSSATITAEVTSSGKSEVTERGIVVGSKPDVTIENGEVYLSGGGSGIYNINVTNLDGLKFYVRAYAINEYGIAYSEPSSFFTVPDDNSIDLSALGTANCYIVSNVGAYKIRTVKGNSLEPVGDISKVDVLWETFMAETETSNGALVPIVSHNDNYILFKTDDAYRKGNALIAAKDSDGTILWSWHIWVTDRPQEQIYPNGAGILMDRNLGAISATGEGGEIKGLFYQWGRKDPFLEKTEKTMCNDEVGTIAYTIQNPTVFIADPSGKNFDDTRWLSIKTIYDPCPIGWRVPEVDVWSGAIYTGDEFLVGEGNSILVPLSSDTFATYPIQSYINYYSGEIENGSGQYRNLTSCCWSVTLGYESKVYTVNYSNYHKNFTVGSGYSSSGYGVRCQKEE